MRNLLLVHVETKWWCNHVAHIARERDICILYLKKISSFLNNIFTVFNFHSFKCRCLFVCLFVSCFRTFKIWRAEKLKKKLWFLKEDRNWNSLDKTVKLCKTTKNFRNQLKSVLLSEYNWFRLGACLVYFCAFCPLVNIFLLKPLLRAWFSQAFMIVWSCPQYHIVFFYA